MNDDLPPPKPISQGEVTRLRDHGKPHQSKPVGVPTWVKDDTGRACPNCGGALACVSVQLENPMLRGGGGTGTYLGCPACPYASQMMMVSRNVQSGQGKA